MTKTKTRTSSQASATAASPINANPTLTSGYDTEGSWPPTASRGKSRIKGSKKGKTKLAKTAKLTKSSASSADSSATESLVDTDNAVNVPVLSTQEQTLSRAKHAQTRAKTAEVIQSLTMNPGHNAATESGTKAVLTTFWENPIEVGSSDPALPKDSVVRYVYEKSVRDLAILEQVHDAPEVFNIDPFMACIDPVVDKRSLQDNDRMDKTGSRYCFRIPLFLATTGMFPNSVRPVAHQLAALRVPSTASVTTYLIGR